MDAMLELVSNFAAIIEPYLTGKNATLLALTWGLTELLGAPLVNATVKAVALAKWRAQLDAAAPWAKRVIALAWCSGLVWIPTAQPPICAAGGDACQTVLERLTTGVMLAFIAILGHTAIKGSLRLAAQRRAANRQ